MNQGIPDIHGSPALHRKVGQIMEILRQRGVRLIAINDGVEDVYKRQALQPRRLQIAFRRKNHRHSRSLSRNAGNRK